MLHIETLAVGDFQANAYLVWREGAEEAFLVDAGDDAPALIDWIARSGKRLTDILLTHGHHDHTLGAEAVREATGAKLWIAAADAPYLRDPALNLARGSYAPIEADAAATGEIVCADLKIAVLATPGHTPGGVCYYLPEEAAIFTGDTLFVGGYGRTDFPLGDQRALIDSLRALLRLPPETMAYPGHGGSDTIGRIRRGFR